MSFLAFVLDPPMGKIDEVSADDFRKLLDMNFISYFLMAKVRTISCFDFNRNPGSSLEIKQGCSSK